MRHKGQNGAADEAQIDEACVLCCIAGRERELRDEHVLAEMFQPQLRSFVIGRPLRFSCLMEWNNVPFRAWFEVTSAHRLRPCFAAVVVIFCLSCASATGESLLNRLDDDAVSPVLIWDESCRDRLSALTWEHWDGWSKRVKLGASLRWMPAYLAEEVLLPEAYATEPCVAGLYFRLYANEPGFALEKDMVEGFLVCSVEVRRDERERRFESLRRGVIQRRSSLWGGGAGDSAFVRVSSARHAVSMCVVFL